MSLSADQKTAAYNKTGGLTNKSIHVTSTEDVSVYILNQQPAATDATNVQPTENLGNEYYQISYAPSVGFSDGYMVVATEDGTNIYMDGNPTPQATLNAGGVYTYHWPIDTDGTGAHITSDKPVAYFVVNSLSCVPQTIMARDPLFQQFPPVNQWGSRFFVPMTIQEVGRVRIMASQDGTNLTVSPAITPIVTESFNSAVTTGGQPSLSGLNAGQYVELEIGAEGCFISSDKPVGVCAYMVGNTYTTVGAGAIDRADPSMAWIPSIEQSLRNVLISPFIPSGTSQLATHYALIVTPTLTKDYTTVAVGTGSPAALGISWVDNATSGFSYGSLQLTQNTTYLFSNPKGLVVNGYGIGNIESYYYLAGSAARNLEAAFYINGLNTQIGW